MIFKSTSMIILVFMLLVMSLGCKSADKKPPAIVDEKPALVQVEHKAGLVTGQPGMNTYPDAGPGEASLLPRIYPNAPPQVPHSVEGLAIKRSGNDCLGCHEEGVEVSEGHVATKVPASHMINEHTGKKQDELLGIRYNCLQCHVPQSVD